MRSIILPELAVAPTGPNPTPRVEGLYIHVPFCFHKCHYCDFYSIVDPPDKSGDRQEQFAERLIEELDFRAGKAHLRPRTVFVGGGTPTILRAGLWRGILGKLGNLGALDGVEEFTVEANPETVTAEMAQTLREGGVNRMSIGCQSFDAALLKTLERWHDPRSVTTAVETARAAGIKNINLDLIFAIPGQTLPELDADLEAALVLEPQHLSCYGLTYEPNTPMTRRLSLGLFRPAPEELERDMYARIMDRLAASGFEHYEISSWAASAFEPRNSIPMPRASRPEPSPYRCRHNLLYWTNADWLGIGPSAASHIGGYRWKNDPHLGRYLKGSPPPTIDHEHLSPTQSIGEILMLGLRMPEGVRLDWIECHTDRTDPRHPVMDELVELGMLERTDTHLRLSHEGLFVADSVIGKLL